MSKISPRRRVQIKRMTQLLEQCWVKVPGWRLGQVFSNLLGPGPHDVFFPEDPVWERLMNDFMETCSIAESANKKNKE